MLYCLVAKSTEAKAVKVGQWRNELISVTHLSLGQLTPVFVQHCTPYIYVYSCNTD